MTPADLKNKGFIEMPDGSFVKPPKARIFQGQPEPLTCKKQRVETGASRVCEITPEQNGGSGNASTALPVAAFNFKPTVSTDEAKLNKTETARLAYLRGLPHVGTIHIQSETVKIADDCRLTADFFYHDEQREKLVFEDTKGGFWREDAKIKIKAAARMFREFCFIVAHKEKDGWREEEIKP